jgi:hypothetical protein
MKAIRLPFQFDAPRLYAEIKQLSSKSFREIPSSYISAQGLYGLNLLIADIDAALKKEKFRLVPNPCLASMPYVADVLHTLDCKKNLARIHKLQPNAHIRPHQDGNMNIPNGVFRIHIPVSCGRGSVFTIENERINMNSGECWYLDVSLLHEVRNLDDEERIHLVMDCVRNDWWDNIFKELGIVDQLDNPYARFNISELIQMRDSLSSMEGDGASKVLSIIENEILLRQQ